MALPLDQSIKKSKSSQTVTEENPIVNEDYGLEESSRLPFPIVGVGASAGGLEAFSTLLKYLPKDTGMAFVLVQHLSPIHKSMLTELLGKKSAMPVTEVTDGLSVDPNHVYVIPPNTCMSIADGVLHLDPRSNGQEQNLPIDFFLSSLADHQKHKAIAVILSGTASDGSQGIKSIKDNGGITFAQDGDTAQFDMMPKNAVATGYIDFVLSPEKIAKELINLSQHPYIYLGERKTEGFVSDDESFPQILMLLQKVSGIDFKNYKPTTLKRRILRRMMLNKMETFKSYVTFLIQNPKELHALSQDVFITVTRFFRDPEAFEALKQDVFPHLVSTRTTEPIRIWVLGCSTGEEVYSLAISFLEFSEGKENYRLHLFATDIKDPSIVHARLGIYAENIINYVSEERLKKFFTKVDRGYQVNKSIRDMCVFARQNVTTDPPFSKLELISCRNLLIYLNTASQKKIMPIFHYALKANGFLLLGQSESVGSFSDLFNIVNKKAKIYSKNPAQKTPQLILGSTRAMSTETAVGQKPSLQVLSFGVTDIQREADRVILKRHHHSGIVINEAMEVIQFRGDTSRYLKHLPGTASLNLLKMVQEGLFVELRNAIQKVIEENIPYKTKSIFIKHNGGHINVSLEIIPFKVQPKNERYFLIAFEEHVSEAKIGEVKAPEPPREDSHIQDLEQELESTRLHLQGTIDANEAAIEELQAANEEILSTNEELQSLNEEFQSANEELESAKEELQATNEEVTTLNDELQNRNTELTALNDDHVNLMNSTSLPIIMVGRDLKIRRFTPVAEKVFRLIPSDIGRPISHLKFIMDFQDLEVLMLQAMNADILKEHEVQDSQGLWHNIQIHPYKTGDNKIDGAVIAFLDITELKRNQEILNKHAIYREAIIQTIHQPFLILDSVLRVKMANQSFYKTFQVQPEETEGRLIFDLGNNQWDIPELRKLLQEILPKKSTFTEFKVELNFPVIGRKIMLLNARQVLHEDDGKESILLAIQDITELMKNQARILASAAYREAIVQTIRHPLIVINSKLRVKFANCSFYATFNLSPEQTLDQFIYDLEEEQWNIPNLRTLIEEIIPKHSSITDYIVERPCLDIGHNRTLLVNARKIRFEEEEEEESILLTIEDITRRQGAEEALRASKERYFTLFNLGPVAIYSIDALGFIQDFNRRAAKLWGREPCLGDTDERFCGSFKMFRPDGSLMLHDQWPMAEVVSGKKSEVLDAEVLIERPDGSRVTVIVNILPLKDSQGAVIGAINCFYDITERKQMEESLRQQKENSDRSNHELEQFAYVASHDLQEPVRTIISYVDLLMRRQKDKLDNEGIEYLNFIQSESRQAQELIQALLGYADITKKDYPLEWVDGDALLKQALSKLKASITENSAEITHDPLPKLKVNGLQIAQLFQNIISNGIKYRSKDKPKIHISARQEDQKWIFSIQDNGIGIEPKHQDRIFMIFKRIYSQEQYPGTGIGLATCRKIVHQHGGEIWVESEFQKGSTFYFSLPGKED